MGFAEELPLVSPVLVSQELFTNTTLEMFVMITESSLRQADLALQNLLTTLGTSGGIQGSLVWFAI